MRQVLVLAAITAIAVARPELYREKEDFQYSRSSTDEGSKSGFYGAQRGNMGGNYERSHNMDTLAQHQMGGLVRTVQGELGEAATQKSGSVFTAANSRGVYGSGHYDLSNLEGRNFQEGVSYDNTQSQASHNAGYRGHTYSAANSANYGTNYRRNQAENSRYNAEENTDQASFNNLQALENLQASKNIERQNAESSGYHSQAGYNDRSSYGSIAGAQSSNGYGSHIRLVNIGPARVYVRPGGRVAIPVAAQTYDDSLASSVDHNSMNTEVEGLNSNSQQTVYQPTNNAKHYESSYKYHKEWEKHSSSPVIGVIPVAIPTISPYEPITEPYEEFQTQGYEKQEESALNTHSAHSRQHYSGYNANSASASHHASYDSEHQNAAAGSAINSGASSHRAYNHGSSVNYNGLAENLSNQVEDIGSKPKSYQSSYSYHKSWERQGDPYIIQPSTNGQYYSVADGQTSQRLTSSLSNQGYSGYGSNQYHHHGHHAHSSSAAADCDENGHIRLPRSYDVHDQQSQKIYEGQQSQNLENLSQNSQNIENFGELSQNLEDFGQQSQNLEDLGQQPQHLEDFGQQSQKLEDLGQQSQNLEDFGQQSQKLEDLGQQTQNLEDFGQQSQKFEDLGQQPQNLEDFGQQSQKLEDLGQQPQNLEDFGQQSQKLESLGQQSQNLEDFGQQSQKFEDLGQQPQNLEDFGQQSQKLEGLGQQSQNLEDFGQQSQKFEDLGQQPQNLEDFGQKSQKLEGLGQQPQNLEDFGQQSQKLEDLRKNTQNLEDFGQQSQNLEEFGQQSQKLGDLGQQTQNFDTFIQQSPVAGQSTQSDWKNLENFGQQTQNKFDRAENLGQQTQNHWDQSQTELGQQPQNTWSSSWGTYQGFSPKDFGAQTFVANIPFTFGKQTETVSHIRQEYMKNSSQGLDNLDGKEMGQPSFTGHAMHSGQNNFHWNQENPNTLYTSSWYSSHPIYPNYFNGDNNNNKDQFDSKITNGSYFNNNEFNSGLWYNGNMARPDASNTLYNTNNFQHSYGSGSSNSYTDMYNSRYPWMQEYNHNSGQTDNTPAFGNSPLSSLWDKLNNLEKETLPQSESHDKNNENKENLHTSSAFVVHNLNHGYYTGTSIAENKTLDSSSLATNAFGISTEKSRNFESKPIERGDIEPEKKPRPEEDVGRGDIGPEDASDDEINSKPHAILHKEAYQSISNPLNKPYDIFVTTKATPTTVRDKNDRSISVQNDHTNFNDLSVLSLQEQKQQDHKIQHEEVIKVVASSATPNTNYIHHSYNPDDSQMQSNDDIFLDQQVQQRVNIDQNNYNQLNGFYQFHGNVNNHHQTEDLNQQNVDHPIVDFGQQNMNIDQQNVDHQIVDFGQQNMNIDQQNVDHQMVDFGQQNINMDQQNVDHQLVDFGHENMNMDHQNVDNQIVDFGQQNMNMDQQNIDHQMIDFRQLNMNMDQQNVDHQMIDFGQQNMNVDQQNQENQMVDFGQQNINEDGQMVDFGQQNQEVDFGQQQQTQVEEKQDDHKEQQLQNWSQQSENIETMEGHSHHDKTGNLDIQQPIEQVETFAPVYNHKKEKDNHHSQPQPGMEPEIVTRKIANDDTPPEVTTANPSFWKRTKDKVVSWFSRS